MWPLLKQREHFQTCFLEKQPGSLHLFYQELNLVYFDSSRESHKHANNAIQWRVKFTIPAWTDSVIFTHTSAGLLSLLLLCSWCQALQKVSRTADPEIRWGMEVSKWIAREKSLLAAPGCLSMEMSSTQRVTAVAVSRSCRDLSWWQNSNSCINVTV